MNEATVAAIEAEIRLRTGINVVDARRDDLRRALRRLGAGGQDGTADILADVLTTGPPSSLVAELVSAVTVNETHFWRIPEQFEALQHEALPELAAGRASPVRIWSAACSIGAEPYSIAMAADAAAVLQQPGVRIVATDVDEGALRLAVDARYGRWAMRGVDAEMRRRWFTTDPDGSFRPVARVRTPVVFSAHSVTEPWQGGSFDIVLCRNLLIYFDEPTRHRVVDNLFDALVPGGLLLVAPAEMQAPLFQRFAPVAFRSGALGYRRPGENGADIFAAAGRPRTPSVPGPTPRWSALLPPVVDRQAVSAPPRPTTATGPPPPPLTGPTNADAAADRIRTGFSLLEAGDGAEAVRLLREATVLAPDVADAHAALALAMLHQGATRRAGAAARRALVLLGDDARDSEAGHHAAVVLGTLAALEGDR